MMIRLYKLDASAAEDFKPAWPVALDVAPDGEILVLDRHGARILMLDSNGRWIGFGSAPGWEPGQLRFPADLTRISNGVLAVADQGNLVPLPLAPSPSSAV